MRLQLTYASGLALNNATNSSAVSLANRNMPRIWCFVLLNNDANYVNLSSFVINYKQQNTFSFIKQELIRWWECCPLLSLNICINIVQTSAETWSVSIHLQTIVFKETENLNLRWLRSFLAVLYYSTIICLKEFSFYETKCQIWFYLPWPHTNTCIVGVQT